MAFVYKQTALFWWSASITPAKNYDVLTLLAIFLTLYFTTNLIVGPTKCISIVFISLKNVYLNDHYAACCVPVIGGGGRNGSPNGTSSHRLYRFSYSEM